MKIKEYIQRAVQQVLFEQFINTTSLKEYSKRAWQHSHLLEKVDFLSEDEQPESSESLASLIKNDQWEPQNPQKFLTSMFSGSRPEMLTPYSESELANLRLFKVKGFDAGFAVKDDGDIVAVHNNTGIGGVGAQLVKAALRNGGAKLDHFDGFLTGFYERFGFKVVSHEPWNDDYAPSGWKYTPVDFLDPQQSIYAKRARSTPEEEWPQELVDAKERYNAGKPDVVYRHV
jgi:hypothetical protein